jgi:hypothetical protein
MTIVIVCGALLLAGLVAGVVWGGRTFASPDPDVDLTAAECARRFTWYAAIGMSAGIAAGISVIGAGGRLAMRLLAVTSDADAQGRVTEAGEIVGDITVDGTIGFVVFNGIFGGIVFGTLFLLVRRLLPAGRLGGVVYGLGLMIVFGAVLDPIRRDNPDFDIVGPGWVSVVVFTLLAVAFGVSIDGFTARMSTWLPQPSLQKRALLRYAGPALVAVVGFTLTVFVTIAGFVAVLVTRWRPVVDTVRSPRWVLGGRILAIAIVIVSLPNTLASVADIIGR